MVIDLGTGAAIGIGFAGLVVAIAVGLPTILSFLGSSRDKKKMEDLGNQVTDLEGKVNGLKSSQDVQLEALRSLAASSLVQRAAFCELLQSQKPNWEVAELIFCEQDETLRQSILHAELSSLENDEVIRAAHVLATQVGNATSLVLMANAKHNGSAEELDQIEGYMSILQRRLLSDQKK